MTETILFSVVRWKSRRNALRVLSRPQNNQERELKRSPEFQKVIRELAELQIVWIVAD